MEEIPHTFFFSIVSSTQAPKQFQDGGGWGDSSNNDECRSLNFKEGNLPLQKDARNSCLFFLFSWSLASDVGTVVSASEVGNESSSSVAKRPKWRGPGNQNMSRRPWKENDPIKLFINSCAYSPTQAVHVEARKLNSTIDNYPVTYFGTHAG